MDDSMFDALCESVKEAGAIRRGEKKASRETRFSALDVKSIRESTGLTQEAFAQMIGVPLSTLRSWEQGKRAPTGPARALLTMFKTDPEQAAKLLHVA